MELRISPRICGTGTDPCISHDGEPVKQDRTLAVLVVYSVKSPWYGAETILIPSCAFSGPYKVQASGGNGSGYCGFRNFM